MGMTIDDVIRYIKDLRDARGCGYQQANVAIDAMRKYQKIEQIVKDDWYKPYQNSETLRRISEVIEDGSN